MVLTGSVLPIPVQGELQITDERIGDEPYCYYRLSSSGDPRWIWGPDLRANVREIPIYRLQGGALMSGRPRNPTDKLLARLTQTPRGRQMIREAVQNMKRREQFEVAQR
jgi:hypothetical protein